MKATPLNKVKILRVIKMVGIEQSRYTIETVEKGKYYILTFDKSLPKVVIDYVALRLSFQYNVVSMPNYVSLTGQAFKDYIIEVKKADKPALLK